MKVTYTFDNETIVIEKASDVSMSADDEIFKGLMDLLEEKIGNWEKMDETRKVVIEF